MMPLYTYAATAVVAVALGFAGGWKTQGWRLGEQIADIERASAEASAKTQAAARAAEQSFALQLQKAQDESAKRETKLRADVADARRSVDGLRGTLYNFRASLPNAAPAAVIARADTAAELLGTCADEYRSVAEAADRIASDRQTLIDAWPKK